jgi:hypothetical protein
MVRKRLRISVTGKVNATGINLDKLVGKHGEEEVENERHWQGECYEVEEGPLDVRLHVPRLTAHR